jgi:acetyl esterase/lipase
MIMERKRTLRRAILLGLFLAFPAVISAQAVGKKPLDHDAYDLWKSIGAQVLADNGGWLVYTVVPGDGDATLIARNLRQGAQVTISRGSGPQITADSRFLVFTIDPMQAVVDSLEEEGTRADDLPKDSLGVIDLSRFQGSDAVTDPEFFKVARVKSWQIPSEENAYLAYLLEAPEEAPDSAAQGEEAAAEAPRRRPGGGGARPGGAGPGGGAGNAKEKEDGTDLVLRHLASAEEFTFPHVMTYAFDEDGSWLAYTAENEEGDADGVFGVAAATGQAAPVLTGEGKYTQLTLAKEGGQVGFLTNRDDWEADDPAYALYYGVLGEGEARMVADAETAGIPDGWEVSENGSLAFSGEGTRLFFGTAPTPPPPPADTLPEDEQVEVDIWNWQDPLIQPMQLLQVQQERRRTYTAYANTADLSVVQLASEEIPDVTVSREGEGDLALGTATLKYGYYVSHDGTYGDVYLMDVGTGEPEMILEKQRNPRASFSPEGRYVSWYDGGARQWFVMDVNDRVARNVTEALPFPVYDELYDQPDDPSSYGSAGWLEEDAAFLVYDDFDIWSVDPRGEAQPRNLTEGVGRAGDLRFRYIDPTGRGGSARFGFGGRGGGGAPFQDVEGIPADEDVLLTAFQIYTKQAGFYRDRFDRNREPVRLLMGDYSYGRPQKADDADVYVLTRQSFQEFPDLWVSDLDFRNMEKISDANPQQAEYSWGTAELVEWISNDGIPLQGILAKPEGFDPNKKYPMMVYFYERSSDGLHQYRTIRPGSSSVIPSFYVSRGYVFFIPDIPYEIGHPGESAIDAVVPGVLRILEDGYVDKDRIGVQGHSWGGYQIAYMVTRTNLFAAAEAGAPVANMTSAYGGIRWGSGMSRQFQYEKTQSRIGGSLWDETLRYIENSPLFEADKVQTPLLMMHNDQDDAVPWYQGIEMYMALRRLQKPVWLVVYNGEPHGLRKRQNQKDWMVRMQQFFDHYLMDAPAPVWMTDGVPAVMKGQTLGLEIKRD